MQVARVGRHRVAVTSHYGNEQHSVVGCRVFSTFRLSTSDNVRCALIGRPCKEKQKIGNDKWECLNV